MILYHLYIISLIATLVGFSCGLLGDKIGIFSLSVFTDNLSAFRLKIGILPLLFCRDNARFLNKKKDYTSFSIQTPQNKLFQVNFDLALNHQLF